MTKHSHVWTDDEICCLLAIWSDDAIQQEVNGCYRKDLVWQKIAQALKRQKQQFRMFFNAVLSRGDSQEEALSTTHPFACGLCPPMFT